MSAAEIKELRQSGKLEEALRLAIAEFQQNPGNVWTKRNLSWVYYDYAKKNCSPKQFDAFCEYLKEVVNLELTEEERMLFDNLTRLVVKMGYVLLRETNVDLSKFDILFDIIKNFHFSKPSTIYSSLIAVFHRAYKNTTSYISFAEWWDFDNFTEEDYEKKLLPNGKLIMSLVEQCYIAYAKQLLPKSIAPGVVEFNSEKASEFIQKLDYIEEKHPEYQYPSYYKAKLLLSLGDQNDVLSTLLPFAKRKRNEFWVWEVMSEAFAEETEKVFACYCKGLLCVAPDTMTVNLRAKIVPLFIGKEMWDEARTETDKIIEIRKENDWKIPNPIIAYQSANWYQKANRNSNNIHVYKQYAPVAEALLYSDIPEETIIVDFVNSEKKIINFITSEEKRGFLKYNRFIETIQIGDVLKARFLKHEKNGLYQIGTLEKHEDVFFQQKYIKNFSGFIRIKENHQFGFVDDVFVAPFLCEKHKLSSGDSISGLAIKSYNEKKKQWGWRAYKINK